ncbi:MAG TPA: bifunctional diguanylate cyclase/phosphodiesterase, partial [Isosphaeraceae bacterium]|nr:bifunctional diguanylate cyclase/phosphodiesterase [Isosphaeraceae bacterium]
RLGGDEFGVLLEDLAQPDSALETATRITEAVRPPLMVAGHQVLITISVGIALASETCDATEQLLRAADVALYEAKAAGKDRFEVFDSQMLTDVFSRIALKADLAILAERPEQLELHYQPIVEIRTGKITGLETLVRWQHPKRGLLYPDAFIKSAEETGAIAAIGAAILEQACEQFSLWRVRGIDCQNISVNLSARQLREPDLVATVKGALNRHGMSPDQLTLEVTETIMMLDAEKAIERLHELKTLGVEIAIDDFGTGYSSFEYLRRLPVDTLKIDRTFTSELGRDSNTVVLVDLMNQLAHAVGLRTVVEGVETEEQLQTVRLLACDEAQGYLVARPAAAAAIEELISRGTWDGATTGLREMTAQLRG